MLIPRRVAIVTALNVICATVALAAEPSYRWKAEQDRVSLLADEQVVWTFHFAADEGCPYLHPLRLPGGPVMTAFAPDDHPWHRGVWFSWKYLDGVNYWEFARNRPNRPDGTTAVVAPAAIRTTESAATVKLKLEYSKDRAVLVEERTLWFSVPRSDGAYTIDWTSKFTAQDQDVVFDRTPPERAAWGGYAGLGFRASKDMQQFRAIDSQGRTGRAQAHGHRARWMDFSGVFASNDRPPVPVGLAIFDHPANPRHPTRWYLSDSAGLPYFGPAPLFGEPMTLNAGDSFSLRYRILVHPGFGDAASLEKEYHDFAD